MSSDYWKEAFLDTLEQCGLWDIVKEIPPEKLNEISISLENWSENKTMYYSGIAYDPLVKENEELKKNLDIERNKVFCKNCNGKGYDLGSQCWKCNGYGRYTL